jgi:hypothetical protein
MEGTEGVGGACGWTPVPHHGPLEGQRLVVDAMQQCSWWETDPHAEAYPGNPNNCEMRFSDETMQEQLSGVARALRTIAW